MAGQPHDPRTFNSWEDAFQYPLPVVRKLEQQLRKNIDENRQKLRSLAGASYRDLLGTAERIIEMDEQMQTVESSLSDIGRKCNTRVLEKAGDNQMRMQNVRDEREKARLKILAQTKVLQRALTATSRTIKADGDALLAAKLLVLARLLHKSLAEEAGPPPILEDLRRKLGLLRKKLLSYIERALVKPVTEKTTVANTLCAYSLVSSSTPKDVLRHFLQARLEQIEGKLESLSESTVLQMLELYKQTLKDARALFPRLFVDSLSALSRSPLLQDAQIRSLHELSLDVYEAWIADDIRAFTPWVRHEQLPVAEVHEGVLSWSTRVQQHIADATTSSACQLSDPQAIISMRRKVLSQYFTMSSELPDYTKSETVDVLRTAFTQRLKELIEDRAASVQAILVEKSAISPQAEKDLWSLSTDDFDLSNGALPFRNAVIGHRSGRDATLQEQCERLDRWIADLDELWEITLQMRSVRWDSEMDVDIEDIPDSDEVLKSLTKADPADLQDKIRKATVQALQGLQAWANERADANTEPAQMLRLLREIHERQRTLAERMSLKDGIEMGESTVTRLHSSLATAVIDEPLQRYTDALTKRRTVTTTLWDGTPPLPVQPSPSAFRLLTSLHEAMSSVGMDVWSGAAVGALKKQLDEKLTEQLSSAIEDLARVEQPLVNGHAEAAAQDKDVEKPSVNGDAGMSEASRNHAIQLLFDALYLQRFTRPTDGPGHLQRIASKLQEYSELEPTSQDRLRKSTNEYWKRTYLLFGLLAIGS